MILFKFSIQSVSDVITNSSSELFVFRNRTKELVSNLLDSLYPDWRTEYKDPEPIKEMSEDTLRRYISWTLDKWGAIWKDEEIPESMWPEKKGNSEFAKIARDHGLSPEKFWKFWSRYNPNDKNWRYRYPEISKAGMNAFKRIHKNEIALWSKDENPNWEWQEKLETVATRYHLG